MTAKPGDDSDVPTSSDAARILEEIAPVTRRSRRMARDVALARPLIVWGLSWVIGAVLFQYVPGTAGAVLGTVAGAAAAAATWLVRPREVRLETERRFGLAWLVLLAISPLLVAVAAPANAHIMVVFLASLWAAGMLVYGIAIRDIPLAMVGLAIVVVAATIRITAPGAAMVTVGITGGMGMAVLGGWRVRWKVRRLA